MLEIMKASAGSSVQIFTTTAAPATTTAATTVAETTTEVTEDESGCSSAVVSTVSAVCIIGTSLAAFAVRKKQEND